jgi:type III restriction enzyme
LRPDRDADPARCGIVNFDRTLIVEVSGSQKSPGPTKAKANTARNSWCAAVNNHGGFGRWGYIEMIEPLAFKAGLADAIQALYGDLPIIGDPDLLDLTDAHTRLDAGSARGA